MPAIKAKNNPGHKVVSRALILVALGVGIFFLMRAVLTLIEPSRAYIATSASSPITAKSSGSDGATPLPFNSQFDAFHRAAISPQDIIREPIIGEDAPETDLNLTLTGRRASGEGSGSATLKLPDGTEDKFLQGETILRNVSLEAIYSTHIIISRGGTHERVTFDRKSGELFGQNAREASEAKLTDRPRQKRVSTQAQELFAGLTPNEFLKSVQPMPVRKGNRVEGYRLRSRDAALDLSKLGLQSGDVVTHIGGEDLRQGAPRFQQIFQRIEQNPANATLTVNRDGQTVTLNLN